MPLIVLLALVVVAAFWAVCRINYNYIDIDMILMLLLRVVIAFLVSCTTPIP